MIRPTMLAAVLLFGLSGCYTQLRDPAVAPPPEPIPSGLGLRPESTDHARAAIQPEPGPYFYYPQDIRLPAFWWADPFLYPHASWWNRSVWPRSGRQRGGSCFGPYEPLFEPWSRWRFAFHHRSVWDPWWYPTAVVAGSYYGSGGTLVTVVYAAPWWDLRPGSYWGYPDHRPRRRSYRDHYRDRYVVEREKADPKEISAARPPSSAVRRAGFGGSSAASAPPSRRGSTQSPTVSNSPRPVPPETLYRQRARDRVHRSRRKRTRKTMKKTIKRRRARARGRANVAGEG
jgi:hypothetical protein